MIAAMTGMTLSGPWQAT